jgi:glycosyltransferase involved in cell wall biosynthesis
MGRLGRRGLEWLARRVALGARASAWLLSSSPLPPLATRVLDRRPDVRQAFTSAGLDKLGFLRWLATEGVAHHHLKPSWCAGWLPEGHDPEVMPRLLDIYDSRPDVQRLFPMAFVVEHDAAGYFAWIDEQAATLGLDLMTLLKARRLLAQDPHARIAEIYASRPDLERAFPGALDDPFQRGFLAWLRYSGWREYGIAEDWVLWFERAREQHACRRLRALYGSRAEWEERHPLAFSPFGRTAFLAAVREAGGGDLVDRLGSPDRLCPLAQSTSLGELRRWHAADASLLALFPRAFTVAADTEALLDWVRGTAAVQYRLDRPWLQRLATEVEGLGLGSEGIDVLGYLRTESGMGELARATIRSLAAVGYPFATRNLSDAPQRQWDSSVGHRDADRAHPFTIVHVNAPEVWRLRTRDGPMWTGYVIGYWAWELGELPREWSDCFQFFDEVWTCSRYAAAAIAASSPVPVQTIWPSLTDACPLPLGRADFGLEPDTFTFLFAYDLLSETERKNPLGLIEAFRRAFRGDDRVRLVLKTTGGDSRKADLARVADAAAGLPITLMDRYLSRPELAALVAACDAYVSLHRAEGFGFTLAEAMAAGKPVAATYHSGNVDYMTPWNSFPIPFRLVDIPETFGPYRRGGLWAEPDLDAAAVVLRTLYRDRERSREVALRGRSEVCEQLSAAACGRRITSRLGIVSPRAVKARGISLSGAQ